MSRSRHEFLGLQGQIIIEIFEPSIHLSLITDLGKGSRFNIKKKRITAFVLGKRGYPLMNVGDNENLLRLQPNTAAYPTVYANQAGTLISASK